MSIKHKILATVGTATMAASIGLAAVPAGAGQLPIGIPDPCFEDCGPSDPTPWNDDDLGFTADLGDPDDGDDPVPADANFTG
jgi:hypothetical protein